MTSRANGEPGASSAPAIRLGTLYVEGDHLVLRSKYRKDLIEAIRRLPARRFRERDKVWVMPRAVRPAILAICEEFDIYVDPAVHGNIDAAALSAPSQPVVVDFVGQMIELDAPDGIAEPQLQEVMALRGRKFDTFRRRWQIEPHLVRLIRDMVERFGWETSDSFEAIPDTDPAINPVLLRADGTLLVVSFPYDQGLVGVMRSLEGARWDPDRGAWTVPVESGMDLLLALEDARSMDVTDRVGDLLDQTRAMIERLEQSRALDAEFEVPGLAMELRPFQRAGVKYASEVRRCLIGDDMGLGKTPQALATLQVTGAWPAMAIVPAVVKTNWMREANKWLPHLRVGALYGMPDPGLVKQLATWLERGESPMDDGILLQYPVQPGRRLRIELRKPKDLMNVYRLITQLDLVVLNYDIIGPTTLTEEEREEGKVAEPGWTPVLCALRAKGLVADESHTIKNHLALRTRAATEVSRSLGADGVILALSGTAVLNRRAELASQLNFIGRLGEFGGPKAVAQMPDIARRMRARCMVRRRKKEVLPELPAREHIQVLLGRDDLDRSIMAEYDHAEADLLDYIAQRAREIAVELGEDPDSAAVKARMRASGAQFLIRINVLRQLAMRAKIKAAERWVTEFTKSDEKLLVFASHLEPLHHMRDRFGFPVIEGAVSGDKRDDIVAAFQGDKGPQVVAIQIDAGGVGLTMTAASNVLFVEQAWSPLIHDQAIDRCYGRLNDLHGASGWYLLAEGTIDEWIAALLAQKRIECEDALDGDLEEEDIEATSVYTGLVERLTDRALSDRHRRRQVA